MMRLKVTILPFLLCLTASATLLPFPSTLPKVSTSYDSILLKTWQGIKKRNVDPYEVKMIHRPYSELPHDAVSEGVGYGMILALYCNDQEYFNKIWDAGEQYMFQGDCYNWRVSRDGTLAGSGAATDAEEDIALCLIFADQLVKKGIWQEHTSPKGATYAQRANSLINNIWNTMVQDGKYLKPGDGWGGRDLLNPGYFAPAFYKVFDEFEEVDHNWQGLIDECYRIVGRSPGYDKGLIPDFMDADGEPKAAGYNTYAESKYLYKDAIRIYWRLATDYLWYGEPRAKPFLQNAIEFLGSPENANFFTMEGNVVPATDSFTLGNEVPRPRAEHSHLTVGMWACAAIAVGGPELAEAYSDELLKFYEPGADYWGKSSDPNGEDTLHNEMYFDQFLAWFGASLISGVFTNIWEDMKDPNPNLPLAWVSEPVCGPFDLDANYGAFTVEGTFNKLARWTVEIAHQDSDAVVTYAGSGEVINVLWYGLSSNGTAMPQGMYDIRITARGLTTPFVNRVWLGRSLDLRENGRLLIDDFTDGDLNPYFGTSWTSYLDNHDRPGTQTSITEFKVKTDSEFWLTWSYRLEGQAILGFEPYAALEWNCETANGNLDLTGLDTIIVTAKSASPLGVSVQLITSDIGDHTFFEDSLYLTSTAIEYKLPIVEFKQRLSGTGRTLDLTKVTAIRFQVQQSDGTENSIMLNKIHLSS